jgi:hypothetical protein
MNLKTQVILRNVFHWSGRICQSKYRKSALTPAEGPVSVLYALHSAPIKRKRTTGLCAYLHLRATATVDIR